MADVNKVAEKKVSYDGLFNFKEIYNFVYTFLIDSGYGIEEKAYKEKTAAGGKDIDIAWVAKKKVTDYVAFEVNIGWKIQRLQDVDVMKDGKKVKMNKGSVEIKFTALLKKDYENKWGTPFLSFMRGIYDKFVIKGAIGEQGKNLGNEMEGAVAQIKSYLVLEGKRD